MQIPLNREQISSKYCSTLPEKVSVNFSKSKHSRQFLLAFQKAVLGSNYFFVTKYPDPVTLPFASCAPESTQGMAKVVHPWEGCCPSVGCSRAGLGAGRVHSREQRQARQLLERLLPLGEQPLMITAGNYAQLGPNSSAGSSCLRKPRES